MHFQGILNNPTTPKLILFQRQNGPLSLNRHQDPQQQPASGNLNFGMSTENSYMPSGKTPNGTFFKEFSPSSGGAGKQMKQQYLSGDGKGYNSGMGNTFGNQAENAFFANSGGREAFHRDKEAESRMWKEFNQHFAAKNRERGNKMNHHDFIDIKNLSKEQSGYGRLSHGRLGHQQDLSYEGYGGLQPGIGETLFGGPNERLQNKLKVLNSMRMRSIQLPFNPKVAQLEQLKEKYKNAQFDQPLYAPKPILPKTSMEGDLSGRFRSSLQNRDKMKKSFQVPVDAYEHHQVFMVLDGQDIHGKDLKFSYIEIAQYIAKMIPQTLWGQKNEKLNLYERVMVAAPALIIQKQQVKEFLQDISQRMGVEIKALFNLDGKRIKTLIQIPMYSKIVIASTDKEFKGLKGVDKIRSELIYLPQRAESVMIQEPEENVEQVESWLQTACIGWMKKTKNLEALAVPRAESPKSPIRQNKDKVMETKGKATFGIDKQSPTNKAQASLQELADEISFKQNQDIALMRDTLGTDKISPNTANSKAHSSIPVDIHKYTTLAYFDAVRSIPQAQASRADIQEIDGIQCSSSVLDVAIFDLPY